MIDPKDREKFSKLQCSNLLDLFLLVPREYEDNRLYETILNEPQLFFVEITRIDRTPKFTRLHLYAKNIDEEITALYFQLKPFHKALFKQGATLYLRGKLESKFNQKQLIQPKPVSVTDKIHTLYKVGININSFRALIKKYITLFNLEEQLPKEIAHTLYEMHFPTRIPSESKRLETLKFVEIYNYLKKMRIKRKEYPTLLSFSRDPSPFINALPFTLTHDQIETISTIASDMQKPTQARRVVIGDVGSGKTVVMLAAAYLCGENKSIIMCPTSILANQIYEEATKYLSLKTTLVTQKAKFSEEELQNSDLLIGTHALLYQNLPTCALVMVDEQHRFGTKQRDSLSKLTQEGNKLPHFLQFSATPIPRTQAMIYSNLVDISLIKELPFKKDIDTLITHKNGFSALLDHLHRESEAGNQSVIVYPLVEESDTHRYQSLEEGKAFWFDRFKDVYITHGKDKEKEEVLRQFREKGSLLLTTTVIEVGISLPKLTTIVIVGAERMGLATLHQLRGRVGRYGQKGHCFLFTYENKNPRLERFSQTLDGFEIAEFDLKYRKSGDLLDGTIQSGKSFTYFDEATDEAILQKVLRYINGTF